MKWLLALLLLCGGLPPALADVWGYIDDLGTAHFAAEAQDERYQLFYRGTDAATADAPTANNPNAFIAQVRLLAYFEVAPGYKAVQHLLREASVRHRLDLELLKALIVTESGFDARAVSPKGAVGLMQLMPTTAMRYGVKADKHGRVEDKLADPRTNIQAGAQLLHELMLRYDGQLDLVLAAYNAGAGAVKRAGNRVPPYKETQNYVKTITQLYTLLQPPPSVALQQAEARVRTTFPAGGAAGRGNMIPSSAPTVTPALTLARDTVFY